MIATLESDIFDLAPNVMWIEDFSEGKALFDLWRDQGVSDIRAFSNVACFYFSTPSL